MTRTLLRPSDTSIDDETPITLAEACAGKYRVHFLLQEAHGGRLTAFKVGRRFFTTAGHMRDFESVTDAREWTVIDKNFSGVYIVGFGNYLKVGWSDVVKERVEQLEQYLPEPLILHGIIRAAPRIEFIAHRRFAAYRLRREWFRNEGDIKNWASSWARAELKRRPGDCDL